MSRGNSKLISDSQIYIYFLYIIINSKIWVYSDFVHDTIYLILCFENCQSVFQHWIIMPVFKKKFMIAPSITARKPDFCFLILYITPRYLAIFALMFDIWHAKFQFSSINTLRNFSMILRSIITLFNLTTCTL